MLDSTLMANLTTMQQDLEKALSIVNHAITEREHLWTLVNDLSEANYYACKAGANADMGEAIIRAEMRIADEA